MSMTAEITQKVEELIQPYLAAGGVELVDVDQEIYGE